MSFLRSLCSALRQLCRVLFRLFTRPEDCRLSAEGPNRRLTVPARGKIDEACAVTVSNQTRRVPSDARNHYRSLCRRNDELYFCVVSAATFTFDLVACRHFFIIAIASDERIVEVHLEVCSRTTTVKDLPFDTR